MKLKTFLIVILIILLVFVVKPEYFEVATKYFSKEDVKEVGQDLDNLHFRVDTDVEDLRWKDKSNLIYIKDGRIVEFDINSREKKNIQVEKEGEYIQSIFSDDSSIACSWFNHQKSDPEEYGTTVIITDLVKGTYTTIGVTPTLKIDRCSSKQILLSEAFPFLQQQVYILDTESKYLTELDEESMKSIDDGKNIYEYTLVKYGETEEVLNSDGVKVGRFKTQDDIKRFRVSIGERYIGYIDIDNSLWVSGIK